LDWFLQAMISAKQGELEKAEALHEKAMQENSLDTPSIEILRDEASRALANREGSPVIQMSPGASKGTTDGRFWSLLNLVVEISAIDRRFYDFFSHRALVGGWPFQDSLCREISARNQDRE